MQLVSITSQGQITIPAQLRRKYNFASSEKVLVKEEQGKIIVEPVFDLDSLAGSLSEYALKDKSLEEISRLEAQAIADCRKNKYQAKSQQSGELLEI